MIVILVHVCASLGKGGELFLSALFIECVLPVHYLTNTARLPLHDLQSVLGTTSNRDPTI